MGVKKGHPMREGTGVRETTMNKAPPPLLTRITLQGFLSYGPNPVTIPLTSLNVFIGPNGAGKSNLIEALSVLRAAPRDLPMPIRQGGGVREWLWKGPPEASEAIIEVVFAEGQVAHAPWGDPAVLYRLAFGVEGDSFVVTDERIEHEQARPGEAKPYCYFGYEGGRPMLNVQSEGRELRREDIDPTQSILSQRRDPDTYPELTRLAGLLGKLRAYRSWPFGPDSVLRTSSRVDVRTDALSEEFDNLAARLAVLKRDPVVKRRLVEHLTTLAPGFDDLEIVPEGGLLQLYLTEGKRVIAARRLSDGTLRFLCLLAVLLDPQPPPLVIIEEPELGLHPDVLPTLRDLMVEASSRCQLLVTTHSTTFIDAFTDHAEAVLVCEKPEATSIVTRLTQAEVNRWKPHGSLGQQWMSGHLGGTR